MQKIYERCSESSDTQFRSKIQILNLNHNCVLFSKHSLSRDTFMKRVAHVQTGRRSKCSSFFRFL